MKYCSKCGKKLGDEDIFCPGCGCAAENPKERNGDFIPENAKWARRLGILSVLLFCPLGIAAIILAVLSTSETGGKMCSQAKWGMIFGIMALCLWLISWI